MGKLTYCEETLGGIMGRGALGIETNCFDLKVNGELLVTLVLLSFLSITLRLSVSLRPSSVFLPVTLPSDAVRTIFELN